MRLSRCENVGCVKTKLAKLMTADNLTYTGWNDDIEWVKLEDGLKSAKEQNKPLMLVVHKTWCGACKALKPQFHTSKEIADLSKPFVMVNVLDDEEPEGEKYSPDGGYIPRVLFYDSEGNHLDKYKNENGHPDYKYYHYTPTSIAETMKKVISDMTLEKPGQEEL